MSKVKSLQTNNQERQGDITYALIYCRVSSDRQATEGHGLEAQELRCREYAQRKGYKVEKVFKDSASGGGLYTSRPEQVAIIEHIDKFPYRKFILVIDDISRFARDAQGHMQLRSILRAKGVSIGCPNFNFEESLEGEVVENVMAVFSEYHRKGNKRQVVQKQKARLEAGYYPFGHKKGYDIVKDPIHGKIAVPNAEGMAIKEGLERYANRSLIRKVDLCQFLVEKGVWKKLAPNSQITQITSILQDSFYAGYIEYPEWEVSIRKGHHQAIISSDLLGLNRKRLQKENGGKRIRNDISPDFKLRGLLVCDDCKEHLTAGWSTSGTKKEYPYYICHEKSCPSYGVSLPRKEVEEGFGALLKKHQLKDGVEKIIGAVFGEVWKEEVKSYDDREKLSRLKKVELEERAQKMTDSIMTTNSKELRFIYEKQLEAVAKEIQSLDQRERIELDMSVPYRTALTKATGLLKTPYLAWESLKGLEQQQLFFFIFEEKLAYSKKTGYRTDKIPYVARLFNEFVTTNSCDVEMPRIELGCT